MPTPNAQPHPTEPAADGPSLRVRRLRDRQSDDPGVLDAILAEAHVAHVGIVRGGHPVVLPFLCAVGDLGDGPVMLLHGSTGGGLFLDAGAEGIPVAATVTHLDGLVFARSTNDSSANYRSAMIAGRATVVPTDLRAEALWQVADHLMPGRRAEVREMTAKEVRATQVLQLPLDRASVKVRAHGVGEDPADGEDHAVWAGVLPLALRAGVPISGDISGDSPVDASVLALSARLDRLAADREARIAAAMRVASV
ncbi:flavin-nucleotide-binding protein [Curtobacterium sp. MCBA15_007]|uniref:pyridoxamine 5'-phosphate oxidase family protein n=1 Tax=Curtobacterium TaxID=2034 RepID=UPI0008DE8313|nr:MULTISPECIES: pyridoxamine 5'-phosphate oxidase family protein [Curtobacterium]MCS6564922.1 pyridoxamine 5'-phosphate oxidase family protein [Curtobacterium flaccumfaciens pv. flaccumfaciens]OII07215.1 flavin-nucleotide-binding protein [Curtobacterium sp. MCBA15_007]